MTTHQKGYEAEAKVRLKAVASGWIVSVPEVEARYDLVLDDGKNLFRVQVKYCDVAKNGALYLYLRKECRNNGKTKVYDGKEVDAIIVYVPRIDRFYWLPPSVFSGKKSLNFRFLPAKNNQAKRTRLLSDFEWVASFNSEAPVS